MKMSSSEAYKNISSVSDVFICC